MSTFVSKTFEKKARVVKSKNMINVNPYSDASFTVGLAGLPWGGFGGIIGCCLFMPCACGEGIEGCMTFGSIGLILGGISGGTLELGIELNLHKSD